MRSRFEGDSSIWVMWMQDYERPASVRALFAAARSEYLKAERVLDAQTELGARVVESQDLSYRVLNQVYDTIAAEFRYLYADRICQPEIPGLTDRLSHEEQIRVGWLRFPRERIRALVRENGEATRWIVEATLRDREVEAREAEMALCNGSASNGESPPHTKRQSVWAAALGAGAGNAPSAWPAVPRLAYVGARP